MSFRRSSIMVEEGRRKGLSVGVELGDRVRWGWGGRGARGQGGVDVGLGDRVGWTGG